MRRFLLVFLLMRMLIGFPTSQALANTPADSTAPTTIDDFLYWTGPSDFLSVGCSHNPDRAWPCIDELYLDGRKLEYRTREQLANTNIGYVNIAGFPQFFLCWAPAWRIPNAFNENASARVSERCSYTQYHISFSNQESLITSSVQPKITLKVRKLDGDFPGTHLGFLHSIGPVHEFTPTSATSEHAIVTISPGLSHGGQFTLELQNYQPPEYATSAPRWMYSFFLASAKVHGVFNTNTGFEMLPESHGAWQATNAGMWGFYGDYSTSDYAIRVAGPHFNYKANPSDPDELNTAWFDAYLPRALVQRQFGLTPEQANENNIEVTRSVGKNPTQLPSTFSATASGLLIETEGITFSAPVISVKRKINIKRNKRMTSVSIINAAGIPRSQRTSARIVVNPCRSSRNGCFFANSRFVFTKKGIYRFTISYKSRDARKKSIVKRSRVTVRVS